MPRSGRAITIAAFLANCAAQNGLLHFVVREFEAFVDCDILSRGFARRRCGRCGADLIVACYGKGRGFCPS